MVHARTAGLRIKALRSKRELSQNELAVQFSTYMGKVQPLTAMTISSWETGRKLPPAETLIQLADFFKVSVDYILGRASERDIDPKQGSINHLEQDIIVPISMLEVYDGEPVYVVSEAGVIESQWGIVDIARKVIVLRDRAITISGDLKYYIARRQSDISLRHYLRYTLAMEDILAGVYDRVYVKSLAPDEKLRGTIEGWYHVDTEHEALLSKSGRVLSLEGLSIYYNAYAVKSCS